MSAMIARANDMRPPAPMPCTARYPASWYIEVAVPQSIEPVTKTAIANR